MENSGSLSLGRGKKFRHFYPQFRCKFNITEEIERHVGTGHRLDNNNLRITVYRNTKTAKPDIENIDMQFDNVEKPTESCERGYGWVPMEYRKAIDKSPTMLSKSDFEGVPEAGTKLLEDASKDNIALDIGLGKDASDLLRDKNSQYEQIKSVKNSKVLSYKAKLLRK